MNRFQALIGIVLTIALVSCASSGDRDTIARLRDKKVEIKEEKIEGGLEKAMRSYERFLEETPETALTPEAIRRLADLKIEKEYGAITELSTKSIGKNELPAPEKAGQPLDIAAKTVSKEQNVAVYDESEADFKKRASGQQDVTPARPNEKPLDIASDLERVSTREAIALYQKLLNEYPLYDRKDQVLYQMARAYEELGEVQEAMTVMDRMVRECQQSRYVDEVQFRRAEYFFTRKRYMDAEDAYGSIVKMGGDSYYFELALYKLGWTFYKQELYEDAMHRFIALLDHKVTTGYDFSQTEDEQERKRTDDTFRVISLSFSNLGGAEAIVEYFSRQKKRTYENLVYSHLGEFYFDKRRYADAAAAYNAFISRNPYHKVAPNFHMRVIEIHTAGGFPSLVLEAKKSFASTYGLKADYWNHFDPQARPEVLANLKTNLTDLAHHYHACYQDKAKAKDKDANFNEALQWYRQYLASFPDDKESAVLNYQLADLLFEHRVFGLAALEYEKTAYGYPAHEKASQAGYAAVFAYREHLKGVKEEEKEPVKRQVVASSLKFADTFPEHEKAAIVLGAAADDLYEMLEYEQALTTGRKLLAVFPEADTKVTRAAWLVVGHASYELAGYADAETAYLKVLSLLPGEDESRKDLIDNLAAAIYKQGEQANAAQDHRAAAAHFLRVGRLAPTSTIRPTAEYDAAAALMALKDWKMAAAVLEGFRKLFPEHALQPEVTKKVAFVYKEDGQLSKAAGEFERIETESQDLEIRREALQMAAELYIQDNDKSRALEVYQRYVNYFPQPVEPNIETRNKIAEIFKERKAFGPYHKELEQIVAIDASAGKERTDRTRFLASKAGLVLSELKYDAFIAVELKKPFKVNLQKKQNRMKEAVQAFNQLIDYEVGDVTAAATFYLAEIYAHFSKSLMTSERPEGLTPLEMEQYELAIEEQAYPFEDRAISVHESNLKLIALGVYNEWIDKSLQKLAKSFPARYDKPEQASAIISTLGIYTYAIQKPLPEPAPEAQPVVAQDTGQTETPADTDADRNETVQAEKPAVAVEVTGAADETAPAPSESDAAAQGGKERNPENTLSPVTPEEPVGNTDDSADTDAAAPPEEPDDAKLINEEPPDLPEKAAVIETETTAPEQIVNTAIQ